MKISMITICLNSEATIERTIQSVLAQKNVDVEYIIVDGKSTDGTLDIVRKYGDGIAKVISEKDKGISDAFNKGIRAATGDVVGIINSDDRLKEGALEHLAKVMKPETDVLFGHGIRDFQDGTGKRYCTDPDPDKLYESMTMVHPAVFIRRQAYEKYGLFDLSYRYIMDRELLLRFLRSGAVFQYDDFYYAFYSMGGVSDKNYVNKLLPEKIRLNKSVGKTELQCRIMYAKSVLIDKLVALRSRLGLDHKRESLEDVLKGIAAEGK